MPFELTEQIQRHLDNDTLIFLSTVTPTGRPAPRPVWFVWDGTAITVFSQPDVAKVRHIAVNPNVSLNTNVGPRGGDVVVIAGLAEVLPDGPTAVELPAYLQRYGSSMKGLGLSPEQFADSYSVHIRITPTSVWTIG
jgi:PPOX class probable F420-dependent enzyme